MWNNQQNNVASGYSNNVNHQHMSSRPNGSELSAPTGGNQRSHMQQQLQRRHGQNQPQQHHQHEYYTNQGRRIAQGSVQQHHSQAIRRTVGGNENLPPRHHNHHQQVRSSSLNHAPGMHSPPHHREADRSAPKQPTVAVAPPPVTSSTAPLATLLAEGACTCKKSRCLKLYCQCFASSTTCGPKCKCLACHNTTMHGRDIDEARKVILERNPSAFEDKFREEYESSEPQANSPPRAVEGHNAQVHSRQQQDLAGYPPMSASAVRPVPEDTSAGPLVASPSGSPTHERSARWNDASQQQPQLERPYQGYHQQSHPRQQQHQGRGSWKQPPQHLQQHKPLARPVSAHPMRMEHHNHAHQHPIRHPAAPPAHHRQAADPMYHQDLTVTAQAPVIPKPLTHKLGCKCRKSFCLKKYCECYHHGAKCGPACRCVNCRNKPESHNGPGEHEGQGSHFSSPYRAGALLQANVPRAVPHGSVVVPSPNSHPFASVRDEVEGHASPPVEHVVLNRPAPQGQGVPRRLSFDKAEEEHLDKGGEEVPNSPRHVSLPEHEEQAAPNDDVKDDEESKKNKGKDRMAIMAALAMTELLGNNSNPNEAKNHEGKMTPSKKPGLSRQVSSSPDKGADEADSQTSPVPTIDNLQQGLKRKSPPNDEEEPSKRPCQTTSTPEPSDIDDQSNDEPVCSAVVSSSSSHVTASSILSNSPSTGSVGLGVVHHNHHGSGMGSRNPSPLSMAPPSHGKVEQQGAAAFPRPRDLPYLPERMQASHHCRPQQRPMPQMQLHQHQQGAPHGSRLPARGMGPVDGAGFARPHSSATRLHRPQRHHQWGHGPQRPHHTTGPRSPGQGVPPPRHQYHRHHHRHAHSQHSYRNHHAQPTDAPIKTSPSPPATLPKSLSYRKICSKCGKTRSEHGELGFGNKCVYQDCGRCGAGIQMHVKANVPMGFLCTLTVEGGAQPGAVEAYQSKIKNLARRAELMQEAKAREAEQHLNRETVPTTAVAAV